MIRVYNSRVEFIGNTLFTDDALGKILAIATKHFELLGETPVIGAKFEGFRISFNFSIIDSEMIFEELLRSSE
jgi:hypothetical protein